MCFGDGYDCVARFLNQMGYSSDEIKAVERETRAQHRNKNWHTMRKSLVTASKVKQVLTSADNDKTAEALLESSTLDEKNLPAAIKFGRENETRALKRFVRAHR